MHGVVSGGETCEPPKSGSLGGGSFCRKHDDSPSLTSGDRSIKTVTSACLRFQPASGKDCPPSADSPAPAPLLAMPWAWGRRREAGGWRCGVFLLLCALFARSHRLLLLCAVNAPTNATRGGGGAGWLGGVGRRRDPGFTSQDEGQE